MAKKHWIYIKRGLSEDPKHRAAMGECIWLYMHIIDRADWETGIAYGWKDKQEAADMGMTVDTLRAQRQKLEKLDYIRCKQKQHDQDIYIMEWKNPRDYGSETKNPRDEGMAETPPSEFQGSSQGSSQGRGQVPGPNPTPSLYSKSKSSSTSTVFGNLFSEVNALPFCDYPDDVREMCFEFCRLYHFTAPNKPKKRDKSQFSFWILSLTELVTASGEFGIGALREQRKDFEDYMSNHNGIAPFTVSSPQSLVNAVRGKAAAMRDPKFRSRKTDEERAEYNPFAGLMAVLEEQEQNEINQ